MANKWRTTLKGWRSPSGPAVSPSLAVNGESGALCCLSPDLPAPNISSVRFYRDVKTRWRGPHIEVLNEREGTTQVATTAPFHASRLKEY